MIQNVNFLHTSFEDSLKNVKKGDFIYLDPPYVPINTKSFVSYVSDGFNKHDILFNLCLEITNKKISFLMSNSDVKVIKDTFNDDKKYIIKNKRL